MRKQQIDYIFTTMLESREEVSDLNITVDKPFQVESYGELVPVELDPPIDTITPFQAEIIALNLIGEDRRLLKKLVQEGSCDISYHLAGKARFRVNIFSQKGYYSTVMRHLGAKIPTIEELGLPESFYKMVEEKNGIILVTGATGSGKTTSIASVLNEINEKYAVHIVTLEDPVEYIQHQKKATFNQRELGTDFDSFATGLRASLRQAPKVILVGEMRDRETVEIALSAAETGHLVLSSVHTIDAGHTINRIVGMFSQEEEKWIRSRLGESLRWVVCQRLLPKIGGGRIAAFEIMGSNMRVRDCIVSGETEDRTFYDIIASSQPFGMMTFDQSVTELYKQELITEETARSHASRKAVAGRMLDMIKQARGEKTTDIEGLTLDDEYDKKT